MAECVECTVLCEVVDMRGARIKKLEADLAAAEARGAQIEARARAVAQWWEHADVPPIPESFASHLDALAEALEGGGT